MVTHHPVLYSRQRPRLLLRKQSHKLDNLRHSLWPAWSRQQHRAIGRWLIVAHRWLHPVQASVGSLERCGTQLVTELSRCDALNGGMIDDKGRISVEVRDYVLGSTIGSERSKIIELLAIGGWAAMEARPYNGTEY